MPVTYGGPGLWPTHHGIGQHLIELPLEPLLPLPLMALDVRIELVFHLPGPAPGEGIAVQITLYCPFLDDARLGALDRLEKRLGQGRVLR